jgi:hypothetical protein
MVGLVVVNEQREINIKEIIMAQDLESKGGEQKPETTVRQVRPYETLGNDDQVATTEAAQKALLEASMHEHSIPSDGQKRAGLRKDMEDAIAGRKYGAETNDQTVPDAKRPYDALGNDDQVKTTLRANRELLAAGTHDDIPENPKERAEWRQGFENTDAARSSAMNETSRKNLKAAEIKSAGGVAVTPRGGAAKRG